MDGRLFLESALMVLDSILFGREPYVANPVPDL